MRTIIAGSRSITNLFEVEKAWDSCGWQPTVVLSGTADGVDKLGELAAFNRNVPIERYPANWAIFGRNAGLRRNEIMVANAEALIAVWDGVSRGTQHTINLARQKGLRVYVHLVA